MQEIVNGLSGYTQTTHLDFVVDIIKTLYILISTAEYVNKTQFQAEEIKPFFGVVYYPLGKSGFFFSERLILEN